MKKLVVFFWLLLIVVLPVPSAFAQDDVATEAAVSSPAPTPTDTDYDLPYPGLLPDSSLYFLKIARDHLVEFLISSPLKKPEFDVLQANKRLNAGIFILHERKGEDQLALTTISKAENYFDDAIVKADMAKKQGQLTPDLIGRLSHTQSEHKAQLEELENEQFSSDTKIGLKALEKRVDEFSKRIEALSSKP